MRHVWRPDLLAILSLTGVILDALGGLYLAYDLLGGKRGPLRTLTKSISYGVLFGIAYGVPLGVWFGLAGFLVSGPALSLEIGRRSSRGAHPLLEALAFGLARALSFGAAGWLSKDSWFGINFGILSLLGFVAAYLMVGPPTDTGSGHAQLDRAVLYRAAFRCVSIGLAGVLSGMIDREPHAISYGIEVGLVTGISSAILVAVAPPVESWADSLSDRRLGGYGAMLVLIGSLLQTFQYVFSLLGQSVM